MINTTFAHIVSIPQNIVAICYRTDLFQKVTDVNESETLCLQPLDDFEQSPYIFLRKRAGGLIKKDDVGLADQCT